MYYYYNKRKGDFMVVRPVSGIDFGKMINKDMEKKQKMYTIFSIVFFALAAVFFGLFIFNMINTMTKMSFNPLVFICPFGIVIGFAGGSIFLNKVKILKRLNQLIEEIKKHDQNDMNKLSVLFNLPVQYMESIAFNAIEKGVIEGYEVVSHYIVLKSLGLHESDFEEENNVSNETTPLTFIKCPGCGVSLSRKDKHCPYCGMKLK